MCILGWFVLIKVNWSVFICILGAYDIYKKEYCPLNLTYNTTELKVEHMQNILGWLVCFTFLCHPKHIKLYSWYCVSDRSRIQTNNHLCRTQTFNHLAKLAKRLSCVMSTFLYSSFDCMLLSCHIQVSEWIYTL